MVQQLFPCPHCGVVNDARSPIGHNKQPQPGSLSICAYCSGLTIYDENIAQRKCTEEMIKAFPPVVQAIIGRLRVELAKIRKQREQQGNGDVIAE